MGLFVIYSTLVHSQSFTPANLPNLKAWYAADTGVVLTSGAVSQWSDISGHGFHAVQATAANRPAWVDSVCLLNNKKVIRFNGTTQLLRVPALAQSQPVSVFFIWKSNAITQQFAYDGVVSTNRIVTYYRNSRIYMFGGATPLGYIAAAPFNYQYQTVIHNSASSRIYQNGILQLSGDPGSNTLTGLTIGADYNNSNRLNGDIVELIIVDGVVSASEQLQVESYLRNKYAPPVNLGTDTLAVQGFCPATISVQNSCYVSYNWSNGATSSSINVTSGTYSVTATDIFGFQSRDTITITRPSFSSLVFNPSSRIICVNDSLLLSTGINNPGYNFIWSNGATSSGAVFTSSGIYNVTVTDNNGCSASSNQVTLVADSFSLSYTLGSDTSLCSGNLIGLHPEPQNPLHYLWNTNDTTQNITVSLSGSYTLHATNVNGCILKDTVAVSVTGAAPILNFAFDTVCLGLSTNFSSQVSVSLPETVDSLSWDFGNGFSDTNANPSFSFPTPGVSSVTLKAFSSNGCSGMITKQVIVYDNPEAIFDGDTTCLGILTGYSDASLIPNGQTATSWNWTIDNTTSLFTQNINYTFTNPGIHLVKLLILTDKACSDSLEKSVFVIAPGSGFPGSVSLLTPSDSYNSNTSNVDFSWQSSTNAAVYRIQVSTDTAFTSIVIDSFVSDTRVILGLSFSLQEYYWRVTAYNVCNESTISDFRSLSVFSPSQVSGNSLWLAADSSVIKVNGAVSVWRDISGNLHDANQSTATLRPLFVDSICLLNNKPVIRFNGTNNYLRISSLTQSQPISSFIVWRSASSGSQFVYDGLSVGNRVALFYNGNSGNVTMNSGANLAYPKVSPFSYTINTVIYHSADTSQIFENGTIKVFGNSGTDGLTGLTIGAAYNTTFYLQGDIAELLVFGKEVSPHERQLIEAYLINKYAPPAVNLGPDVFQTYSLCPIILDPKHCYSSYLWSNGDTTEQLLARISGTYWVRVTDLFGRVSSDTINVQFPYRGMTPNDTLICADNPVTITPLLPTSYTFLWNIGQQTPAITISEIGEYFVSVTDSSGCSFVSDTVSVFVDSFSYYNLLPKDTSVCSNNNIETYSYSLPVINYDWTTPSGNSGLQNVDITTSGLYSVTATDQIGCIQSDTVLVTTIGIAPTIDYTAPNTCFGDTVFFTDNSLPVNPDQITSWYWEFGNGDTSTLQNPSLLYPTIGSYNVSLFIATDSGCTGYFQKTLHVFSQPIAAFTTQDIVCAKAEVLWLDNSSVFSGSFINQWLWTFNDTVSLTTRSPVYALPGQGINQVKLTVTTNEGCSDSLIKNIEAFAPLSADFVFTEPCLGDSTSFTDNTASLSIVKWLWNFDDGSFFSVLQNPKHKYQQSGNYFVNLKIENAIGCTDTVVKMVHIIQPPQASIVPLSGCENSAFTPSDNSTSSDEPITHWTWTIADSLYTNNQAPTHYFPSNGTYPVSLFVTTASGCIDSTSSTIMVYNNPSADFKFTPLYGEAPLSVDFINLSTGGQTYLWSFGDNSVSIDENPSYTYQANNDYTVELITYSPQGCADTAYKIFTVIPTNLDVSIDGVVTALNSSGNGTITNITVQLSNRGSRVITHLRLYAKLGMQGLFAEDWDTLLTTGTIVNYTFRAGFVSSSIPEKFLCVEAVAVNHGETETRTDNNQYCKTFGSAMQLAGPIPNPAHANSSLGIILQKAGEVKIAIVDAGGKYVMRETTLSLNAGRTDYVLPIEYLRAGEYFIRVLLNDDEEVRKLIVK